MSDKKVVPAPPPSAPAVRVEQPPAAVHVEPPTEHARLTARVAALEAFLKETAATATINYTKLHAVLTGK